MGLNYQMLLLFDKLKRDGHLDGGKRLIEIGAQQLHNTFLQAREQVDAIGALFGANTPFDLPAPVASYTVHGAMEHLQAQAPLARHFYSWLGFEYACVDIDESPGSIPLDLNCDAVPEQHLGRFNIVTNFGTTEHVANQLNAFKIIHDLASPGGIMIHELPAQGMLNHGLVNYNPKFFWMLARSNGYDTLLMNFAAAGEYYELPQNIRDFVSGYVDLDTGEPCQPTSYRTSDVSLRVVLRKAYDIPFVPPLDVPTGTPTSHRALQERYWTVFEADAFSGLVRHGAIGRADSQTARWTASAFGRSMQRLRRILHRDT